MATQRKSTKKKTATKAAKKKTSTGKTKTGATKKKTTTKKTTTTTPRKTKTKTTTKKKTAKKTKTKTTQARKTKTTKTRTTRMTSDAAPARKTAVKKTAEKAAAKPAAKKAPKQPKPRKPAKPKVDPEFVAKMRELLVQQRQHLLSVVQAAQAQMAEKDGDLADVSDRASGGYEDELAVSLMAIEAAKLSDIEAAIKRIDDGTYGICVDTGRPISKARLEYLPFALRTLEAEGLRERGLPIPHDEEVEDEEDFDD